MSPAEPKSQELNLKPATITLTTDFGTGDSYVAQMKGVIAGIAPHARVIDGTHDLPAQNVLAAAVVLDSMVDAFTDGTIHLVVVDPGVGTGRAAVAVKTSRFTLVGPDNGVFTLVLERYPPTAIVRLTDEAYHRDSVSVTFHGRDIFAPVAGYLANGVAIERLGEPVTTLVNLNIPEPREAGSRLTGVVLVADHFGNLVTNLSRDRCDVWLGQRDMAGVVISVKGYEIGAVRRTYADVEPGEAVAYFGSSGRLELAVRNGSAREKFGEQVSVTLCVTKP